ncbi:MAG: hypothetical protein JXP34_21665 [Planctomycetes bacterium]|nr:hypothetical protein [Planctomycetota bacterium]
MTCLFAACRAPARTVPEEESRRRLEVLGRIASLEEEVASYASAQEGIAKAEVFVRPAGAIVLLTPSGAGDIRAETIDEINRRIMRGSGLRKDQIVIKRRGKQGGEP